MGSARWAGEAGDHLLIGNLNCAERSDDFFTTQGLLALLLARVWQGWFPGLTDSSPETEPQPGAPDAAGRAARPPRPDLRG